MSAQKITPRKYELKKRAADMAETRRRITEAAVELHGTVGPARTTVSAIARRAGVQRHTVYRYFPTETDLFAACSAHFRDENPWPDAEAWSVISDPGGRLEQALGELYAYYERTAPMYNNILRDAELVDAVGRALEPRDAFLARCVAILASGRPERGRRRAVVGAALAHVIAFETWRSLAVTGGLPRPEVVRLSAALVAAASA
jgi:AcrR family transcriptional regulator